MLKLFARRSGLSALAERYPASDRPQHVDYTKQTVKFGAVRYRRCVGVSADAQGLYLDVNPPLGRRREILIPWDAVTAVHPARLYWRPAMAMSIGDPELATVTVYRRLFESLAPYMSIGRSRE
jgi:hypothetical protein